MLHLSLMIKGLKNKIWRCWQKSNEILSSTKIRGNKSNKQLNDMQNITNL